MLYYFCGAFDVLLRQVNTSHILVVHEYTIAGTNLSFFVLNKEDKVVPAMVDLYNQNMKDVDLSDQVMYSYPFEQSKKHGQKSFIQPSYKSSNEFLYNIVCKLIVGHPKTRLKLLKVTKRCH